MQLNLVTISSFTSLSLSLGINLSKKIFLKQFVEVKLMQAFMAPYDHQDHQENTLLVEIVTGQL